MDMKNKNIKYAVCLMIGAMLISACSDFLDKEPLTQFRSEDFWTTESEVQAALTATYSTFRTSVFGSVRGANGVAFDMESLSDNAITTSGFVGYMGIMQGGINPSTGGAINQFWSDSYNGIAKCNYFLDNIDQAKAFLSDANYNKYKGEALFNRTFFYNELIQLYGDVPLVLTSQSLESDYKNTARTPKADVVTLLLQDIDVAIAGLPNAAYTDGHA